MTEGKGPLGGAPLSPLPPGGGGLGRGGENVAVSLHVNGQDHQLNFPAHHTLLEVLRDELKLISVREGCGIGMCGACTVLLDGHPVSGCLTLAAMAEGHDILTVEGLPSLPLGGGEVASSNAALHPIQQAFIAKTGFQCSYCTPGIILTTKALLDENPDATDEEIRAYLTGNLCRCGSYVKILDSVREAIAQLRGK
jgi:aerobic carbon-monoxide dehydrogenase small subunit